MISASLLTINLNFKKNLFKNLIKTFGLSHFSLKHIKRKLGVNKSRSLALSVLRPETKLALYHTLSDQYFICRDFKFKIKTDIFAKINHRNYMGFRLRNGYPAKGQRTRTNAKTSRFRLHYVRYNNIIK